MLLNQVLKAGLPYLRLCCTGGVESTRLYRLSRLALRDDSTGDRLND